MTTSGEASSPTPVAPAYHLVQLPPPPADRPYVLVNMVMSADGRTVVEGTERGLGSPTDQRLMRELRSLADVVMNGAGTLRASGTSSRLGDAALEVLRRERGQPPVPLAATLTRSGVLPLERAFFTADDFDAVLYAAAGTPEERLQAIAATGRRVFRMPSERPLEWMLRHMREELGARVLLLEGGPHTNGELFDLGLIDEFYLTLAPRIVGGMPTLPAVLSERPVTLAEVTQMELVSAVPNLATGEVYLRYRTSGRGPQ
jgi:2,5-diamino-6-(ribosylamino)-4(3H)-pyrimidinone 5'-phosphate reductase